MCLTLRKHEARHESQFRVSNVTVFIKRARETKISTKMAKTLKVLLGFGQETWQRYCSRTPWTAPRALSQASHRSVCYTRARLVMTPLPRVLRQTLQQGYPSLTEVCPVHQKVLPQATTKDCKALRPASASPCSQSTAKSSGVAPSVRRQFLAGLLNMIQHLHHHIRLGSPDPSEREINMAERL